MPEEWLRLYYETGDDDDVLRLISHFNPLLDRFLKQCVSDAVVRMDILMETMNVLRNARGQPELHWDLKRGPMTGFVFAVAGHLAYRWLVWFEYPGRKS